MIPNDLLELSFKKLNEELQVDLNGKQLNKDITSNLLLSKNCSLKCIISNRERIIVCGTAFIKNFLNKAFPEITLRTLSNEGTELKKNSTIFYISGNAKIILAVERTILNFLQHLCSISTLTNKFIRKMSSKNTKLLNTRKTTTGLRKFEKYATQVGGAINHRMGLYDKILIKDNHIKVLGGIDKTLQNLNIKQINDYQIECENYSQVKKCIKMGIKYILLDNMSPSEVKRCIGLKIKNETKFEITGGISINNIHKYSNLGADYISTGRIANSANSVDIGLDII